MKGMLPLVAIVGRPNVGKSTLFNRLIGEQRAIVLDTPGVTRDRNYGEADWAGRKFDVVDTGGFEPEAEEGVLAAMRRQALLAVQEADAVIFVTDGRAGLLAPDREVASILRRATDKVFYAVNKIDSPKHDAHTAEFYEMGTDQVFPISAEHGRGVEALMEAVVEHFPPAPPEDDEDDEAPRITRVAIIGRPNVGKSTLVNRLLGEDRMIVDNAAGTTRDAIDARVKVHGKEYTLIDTAGLRRKGRIQHHTSEGYSAVRTLRALDRCHVAVLLVDATEGVTDQDARIIGVTQTKGRGLVIAVNKWDAVEKDSKSAKRFQEQMEVKLPFASYAPVLFMSGLTGQRVHKVMELVEKVRQNHLQRIATGPLNRWLEQAVNKHQPPIVKNRRVRFYYATQVRTAPPTFMLSCNNPEAVHFSYERYLVNQLRETFDFTGTPIRLHYRGKENPFVDDEG